MTSLDYLRANIIKGMPIHSLGVSALARYLASAVLPIFQYTYQVSRARPKDCYSIPPRPRAVRPSNHTSSSRPFFLSCASPRLSPPFSFSPSQTANLHFIPRSSSSTSATAAAVSGSNFILRLSVPTSFPRACAKFMSGLRSNLSIPPLSQTTILEAISGTCNHAKFSLAAFRKGERARQAGIP